MLIGTISLEPIAEFLNIHLPLLLKAKDFPYSFLFIGLLVIVDIFFRIIAFKRIESLAIDACIFSLLHSYFLGESEKAIIILMITLIAVGIHRYLESQLERDIFVVFHKMTEKLNNSLPPDTFKSVSLLLNNRKELAKHFLDIDLTSNIMKFKKPHKHFNRFIYLTLFEENEHLKEQITENELLLHSGQYRRFLWFCILFILGFSSMLITSIS